MCKVQIFILFSKVLRFWIPKSWIPLVCFPRFWNPAIGTPVSWNSTLWLLEFWVPVFWVPGFWIPLFWIEMFGIPGLVKLEFWTPGFVKLAFWTLGCYIPVFGGRKFCTFVLLLNEILDDKFDISRVQASVTNSPWAQSLVIITSVLICDRTIEQRDTRNISMVAHVHSRIIRDI